MVRFLWSSSQEEKRQRMPGKGFLALAEKAEKSAEGRGEVSRKKTHGHIGLRGCVSGKPHKMHVLL